MIKHIFIAPLQEGINPKFVDETMQNMRSMKDQVSVIKDIVVNRATEIVGVNNAVVMVVEVESKQDLDTLLNSDAHSHVSAVAPEIFKVDEMVLAQVEY